MIEYACSNKVAKNKLKLPIRKNKICQFKVASVENGVDIKVKFYLYHFILMFPYLFIYLPCAYLYLCLCVCFVVFCASLLSLRLKFRYNI